MITFDPNNALEAQLWRDVFFVETPRIGQLAAATMADEALVLLRKRYAERPTWTTLGTDAQPLRSNTPIQRLVDEGIITEAEASFGWTVTEPREITALFAALTQVYYDNRRRVRVMFVDSSVAEGLPFYDRFADDNLECGVHSAGRTRWGTVEDRSYPEEQIASVTVLPV